YAKWPAAGDGLGNGAVEGGLIVPFGLELPAGFTLGAMTQFDLRHDDDGEEAHAGFINTITVSRALVGKLGAFVEFYSDVESTGAPWAGAVNAGLTLGLTDDLQLDAGMVFGVTRAAPDLGAFAGFAVRF
ncbi:MAG TPA: transporter, partial [Verrucomicrobiota bacterium]|nr:transporter [Verrucomicrobiota bacterium]